MIRILAEIMREAIMISKVVKHMYEGTNTRPNIDKDFKYGPYDDPLNIPCVKSSTTSVSNLLDYFKEVCFLWHLL